MSFVRRRIDVTVTLGEGDFGEAGQNTLTLTGLRCSVDIVKAGDPGMDTAQIRLFGLTASQMNKLSSLGKPIDYVRNNTVSIAAGDLNGVAQVFTGTIQEAYQDFAAMPDAALTMTAFVGLLDATRPVTPSSYPAAADVAVIMTDILGKCVPPLALDNQGVSVTLSSPYFPGTYRQQIEACAKAANFYWAVNDTQTVLSIWPKDGKRDALAPTISSATGMVGYPRYTQNGVAVRTIYMPGLAIGCPFVLKTDLVGPANGTWIVNQLIYSLESETPAGAWFIDVNGTFI